MAREPTGRIKDLVMNAKELGFELIVNSPVTEPDEIRRIAPPIRPGEPLPSLKFYIGAKVWKDFLFTYERYPEVMDALAGIEVTHYTRTKKVPTDGASAAE